MDRVSLRPFTVDMIPQKQGDLNWNPKAGKMYHRDDRNLRAYRDAIGYAAKGAGAPYIPEGPVFVQVLFKLPRYKYHYETKKAVRGQLRGDAPFFCDREKDVDKLTRAVLDALTGICYKDDTQVAQVLARKIFTRLGGVTIAVRALTAEDVGSLGWGEFNP